MVDHYGTLATLPKGSYTITAYTHYASFTQQPGIYQSQSPDNYSLSGSPFPVGSVGNFAVNISYVANTCYGFLDDVNSGEYRIYTQENLNADQLSNGIIIPISASHFIVAFEDGAGRGQLGDKDYNDLVLNVTAPIPGSLLLLGIGVLGLAGLGIRRKSC